MYVDEFIISLVAVGDFYIKEIETIYKKLKLEGFNIKVLTNDLKSFDQNDVVLYQKSNFNYFDKIYFSLSLIKEYKKSVIYFDGSVVLDVENLISKSSKENTHFIYTENWPGGNFLKYKDESCFRFLLEYFQYRNVPVKDYPTISEKIMVFNKNIDYELIQSELEKIQPVFDFISLMNDMTYTKPFVIGGAEGLALSIVLTNNKIPHIKLNLNENC